MIGVMGPMKSIHQCMKGDKGMTRYQDVLPILMKAKSINISIQSLPSVFWL